MRIYNKGLNRKYIDAIPDIKASIAYAKKYLSQGKFILWGSSYSSSLALYIANQSTNIDAVLAFAPGEYYKKESSTFIEDNVKNITIPVFITSAKIEKKNWWKIYAAIPSKNKHYFLPEDEGIHGSKALWKNNPNHKKYWNAVREFLKIKN